MKKNKIFSLVCLMFFLAAALFPAIADEDVLPGWNDVASKQAIVQYINKVTAKDSDNFIKPEDRIAVFDNDGTVQPEKPYAFVDMFAIVRIRDLGLKNPKHLAEIYPEWKSDTTVQDLVKTPSDQMPELLDKMKYEDLIRLFNLANSSDSQEAINSALHEYVYKYSHIRFREPPAKLVYKPMIELIKYLKDNGFTVYFVSGSTTDYLRQFSENIGIEKNNVIGWTYNGEVRKDKYGLLYVYKTVPPVEPLSVKEGKVVDIERYIGRRPVVAVGNSGGDIAMLTYTHQNTESSLCLILDHTDEAREYKYDFGSAVRSVAKEQGWTIIDMQKDFKTIF